MIVGYSKKCIGLSSPHGSSDSLTPAIASYLHEVKTNVMIIKNTK
ncbi:hypothetical protein SDC9_130373 [bioreactor metagenome]|uniref:Uncharacterized protein n=1 Tax=bioreactor metagenome TaxID=1076179 RepID=A0A645D279_9ZZZZ